MGWCVHVGERQGPRDRHQKREIDRTRKKREMRTHQQNAPSFKPQLGVFDDIFLFVFFPHPPLSLSLVKRAITCPGRAHIKQTLVLSPEPDTAKLHCFQMLISDPAPLIPPSLHLCACPFLLVSFSSLHTAA